ncbi:MAG: TIGR02646 family protein [Taibaiella sp.]|nr:TIGR02646 family protein [Taibaiella sp.]
MIAIKRTEIPSVLANSQQSWTNDLQSLVSIYGTYRAIPPKIRDEVVNRYRHDEIKAALLTMHGGVGKCIYCESIIDVVDFPHIEHFFPKSIYYLFTFKWSNLYLSCAQCNISKGDTDTRRAFPIVNPSTENPEMYFIFEELRIKPSNASPDKEKSANTIRCCNLDRIPLSRAYADILCGFYEVEQRLEVHLAKYHDLVQDAAKLRVVAEIMNALDSLKSQVADTKSYAGFFRFRLRNSNVVSRCVGLINLNAGALGINGYFVLHPL